MDCSADLDEEQTVWNKGHMVAPKQRYPLPGSHGDRLWKRSTKGIRDTDTVTCPCEGGHTPFLFATWHFAMKMSSKVNVCAMCVCVCLSANNTYRWHHMKTYQWHLKMWMQISQPIQWVLWMLQCTAMNSVRVKWTMTWLAFASIKHLFEDMRNSGDRFCGSQLGNWIEALNLWNWCPGCIFVKKP